MSFFFFLQKKFFLSPGLGKKVSRQKGMTELQFKDISYAIAMYVCVHVCIHMLHI